ncbi:MAG: HNH endonuclease [Nocardioidaceae bacterium]
MVRSTEVSRFVRGVHDHTCQICGLRLESPAGGYSEGAHIRPLGRPHDGSDTADNVLCPRSWPPPQLRRRSHRRRPRGMGDGGAPHGFVAPPVVPLLAVPHRAGRHRRGGDRGCRPASACGSAHPGCGRPPHE